MTPFFSVIIPLYNKENYIQATIASVLKQTFSDFEIILINDGSTDQSLLIAEKALSGFGQKTISSQENKGLSATRNKAIALANGKVIALLDADDLWKPNYLNDLHHLVLKFPRAHLFGSDYIEFYSDSLQLKPKKNISEDKQHASFIIEDFFKTSVFQPLTVPSSFAFKIEVFEHITFNENVTFAEDIEFYITSNLAFKMAFCFKPLVVSRQDIPKQMTKMGFKGKVLPDLNKFEAVAKQNPSLKKYLDTNRYYFLSQCRLTNDTKNKDLLEKNLNLSNLTVKQRFLLKCPVFVLKNLKKLKAFLLKNKIRVTTY
jgi:glycosyltransferase involved in cell wall biosynthesis